MSEILHLSLLGKLHISLGDTPVEGFISSKAEALLCYLAVSDQTHYRDSLVGLLWSEAPEAEARASLRVVLSNLRKLVGNHLTITRETVAFNSDAACWLDVEIFLAKVRANAGEQNVEQFKAAIELYRGDFLEGFYVREAPVFEEWLLLQRERLHQMALQALHALAQHYATQRDYPTAIDYTTRLLVLDPWREEAHQLLMLMLARNGQRSAALAQYEICRRMLAEELGVEPMAETTALYHRLRSLPAQRRHNLPAQATPFVGRERELVELNRQLATPACRLLTLVGPGGIGKTRLALQAAAEQVETGYFLDGVYYIPLTALSSLKFLASTLSTALDFTFYGQENPTAQLLNYLRDKEMLLVLDNFEHLLPSTLYSSQPKAKDGDDLLTAIIQRAAGIKLLVTSQQRLNLRGEWIIEIQGLSFPKPSPEGGREGIEAYSAVQLFWQSAQRAQTGFTLSSSEQAYVARICQLVAGIPLGIEMAAAWVRVLSYQEIVREIEHHPDFLSTPHRDLPERQQSLRAVFEYSWQLLSEAEQHALKKLTIFVGGFRREMAEQVAQTRLPLLTALIDKSFLHWSNQSGERYEIHELLRQYALEKLQADPAATALIHDQHSNYFATFLQQRETRLQGRHQKEALTEINQEIENIRTAWNWLLHRLKVAEIERGLTTLFLFYEIRGWYEEGSATFAQTAAALAKSADLDEAANPETRKVLGQILARQGVFQRRLGQYRQAEELLQKSLTLLSCLDSQVEMAFSLNQMGNVAGARGEYSQAKQYYQESLAIKRKFGDLFGIAISLNNLGYTDYLVGAYDTARQLYTECLDICRDIGDDWGVAQALNNLGLVAEAQGDYTEAKQLFENSLTLSRELGDPAVTLLSLNNLGLVAKTLGALAEAEQRYQESLAISRITGNRRTIALSLNNLGAIAYDLKEYNLAQQRYQESLAIRRKIGDQLGLVYALNGLGNVACALLELQTARQYFIEALQIATAIKAIPATLTVLLGWVTLLIQEKKMSNVRAILNLILCHPASDRRTKDQASHLLTELETELPPASIIIHPQPPIEALEMMVAEIIAPN